MTFRWRTVVAASCLWLSPIPAGAQWSQCASDLNDLSTVAREVHETADRVTSIQVRLRSGEEAYARCVQDRERFRTGDPLVNPPGIISSDECSLQILSYRSAERQYETEMNLARQAFADLAFAVQTVEQSCQYPLATMAPAPGEAARSPACDRFLRQRRESPAESLHVLCGAEMSAEDCRACLGEPLRN